MKVEFVLSSSLIWYIIAKLYFKIQTRILQKFIYITFEVI